MRGTWRFDIGHKEPVYYHFRSFKVYNAFRWSRCERYGICAKHFYSNKDEYQSWLHCPMKKNMEDAEEKKRMTVKRSDPIFTYHYTCGRCMVTISY